jgi:hypothetical protein
MLPVIDLDLALENRVESVLSKSVVGGHDVPGHAHLIENFS